MALPTLHARHDVDMPGLGGGWTLLVAADLRVPAAAQPLDGAFGRGGVLLAGELVVRPYRRGGLLRKVNSKLYVSPRRFEAELAVHRALWERGFPTVEPLGCAYRRRTAGFEGLFLTRLVPGSPWPRTWRSETATLAALARGLRALADWGLWAPDLNATNVHLGEDGLLRCLDWDRATFGAAGPVLLDRYAARLQASFQRLGAPAQIPAAFREALARPSG